MNPTLRIIFAGTPNFAAIHLQGLLDSNHSIVAVFTQPDRPAGRGKKLTASPVKQLAENNGLTVHQPKTLKGEDQQKILQELGADLMIVVAYGLILPQTVLDIPKYGCINVHASLLPRWRGAAPIQRAIQAGDSKTGITIIQMDAGLDTGTMLCRSSCAIRADETAASLHDKLANLGTPALQATLQEITYQQCRPEIQNNELSTYATKITKAEALIDWAEHAETIEQKVRAFNPVPIAYSTLETQNKKEERVKIWSARAHDSKTSKRPGTIIEHCDGNIVIACGKGELWINQLQLPGGRPLESKALLNSGRQQFDLGRVLGH